MSQQPAIILSSLDYDRIDALLAKEKELSPVHEQLLLEMERATLLEPEQIPADVVTMHSRVRFKLKSSGKEFEKTLCYPHELAAYPDAISVFAPVGAALIGLAVGQYIDWPMPGGQSDQVEIVELVDQPERKGEYHR
ncbi:nucleoside diphosphate kinase regulator [Alkalimonas amylolytica]|uniref:Regulator of nucleoside diphosphate kinase n=1 Tax=Alkalimonas amylolytica TaxID=152573 RepID=A0A1H4AVF2_ALKAM|nr:nucleoside diphosphate kinase regulator [Alkalimonas amylolytica]SEA39834.1 regulator of nucleoside diphosphate kinase [Alkalimonas amylolytica]